MVPQLLDPDLAIVTSVGYEVDGNMQLPSTSWKGNVS